MCKIYLLIIQTITPCLLFSQGYTNIWELGYFSGTYDECSINFSSGSPLVTPYDRPMNFRATSASICDTSGALLFYTNGVYVANANHDTMMNGSGINPGQFTNTWKSNGLPIIQGALILPWPDSANKYFVVHETLNYDTNVQYRPKEVLYSIIDMNVDSGRGGVVQKNIPFLSDTVEAGITACKHGNGRDWWVIIRKFYSDIYYRILITPDGIASTDTQKVGGPISIFGGQTSFSPDGKWYASFDNTSMLRVYDFDRCSGTLSNLRYITINDSIVAGGVSFSPNSQRLYINNAMYVYQFDLSTTNIATSKKLIATYDGYYSPTPPFACDFWDQMLGPDGKIYINSGASVVDLHVINSPDNLDTLCDLQQHSLFLNAFNKSTLPNHINYQLGALTGSVCDTLTAIEQVEPALKNVTVFPNPNHGEFTVYYTLPKNEAGLLILYDINGKQVWRMNLPPWSTLQRLNLPQIASGLYALQLYSGNYSVNKKIIIE